MKKYRISRKILVKMGIWWLIIFVIVIGICLVLSKLLKELDEEMKIFIGLVWLGVMIFPIFEMRNLKKNFVEVTDKGLFISGRGAVKRYSQRISFEDVRSISKDSMFYLAYPPLYMIEIKTRYTSMKLELNIYENYEELFKYIYAKTKDNSMFNIDLKIEQLIMKMK